MYGNHFLDIACKEAWKYQFLTFPNPAVGCVITTQQNEIVAIGVHQKAGFAHAELNACKIAYEKLTNTTINTTNSHEITSHLTQNHNDLFKNLNIYVTLEPCSHEGKTPSCALLLHQLGFKNITIGQLDNNEIAKNGKNILKNQNVIINSHESSFDLLYPFLKWQKDRFVFFKIALNANHTYDTGIISNKHSRKLVHQIREKIDLLIIGGESVRIDRPTLDTRLSSGQNAPDVLIFSKQKSFDADIPLFQVPNRKVTISSSLEIPQEKRFVMIEGGYELFKQVQHLCDWVMVFQSPNIKDGKKFILPSDFALIHQREFHGDTINYFSRLL